MYCLCKHSKHYPCHTDLYPTALQARKLQERGWQPRWFRKDEEGCYRYVGGYWEARKKANWEEIPDIFGQTIDLPPSTVDE